MCLIVLVIERKASFVLNTPEHVENPIPTPINEGRIGISRSSASTQLEKSSGTYHSQLSSLLREKIYSREWEARKKIPSEHQLMEEFGLSRGTVRHAIKTLVEEGLLVQVHGKGTFVTESALSHPAGVRPLSFAESLREQGKNFMTLVLDKKVLPAPSDVAHELRARKGAPFLFLRRVRLVDGTPLICQESWTNLEECPGYENANFEKESAFDAAQRCGARRIAYSRIRYTARVAGAEHGRYLKCDENAPLLVLEQNIRFSDGAPFEWSLTWLTHGQAVVGDAIQPQGE